MASSTADTDSVTRKVRCPYPDCTGMVNSGSKFCPTCRRPLMGASVINSGVDQSSQIAPSTEFEQAEPLLSHIADAYRATVLANANMRSAMEVLESLRAQMLLGSDFYQVWDAMEAQIGMADPDTLQPVLVGLRNRFVDHVCSKVVARLQAAFERNIENGWREWLRTYAEALSAWRLELCRALIQADFPWAELRVPMADALPRLTQYLWWEQWPSTYELFVYLAQHVPISDVQRAKLLVEAAAIKLYHLEQPEQARELLAHAEELAPDENKVRNGWGEYWLEQRDINKAKQCFDRAIQQAPGKAAGYCNLALLYRNSEDLSAAEDTYKQARRIDSGSSTPPMGLIELYGRPQLFSERRDLIPSLMKHAVAVDPQIAYAAYLAAGYDYQQNSLYEQAHQYYDQAISLEPGRIDGYASKGHAFLEVNDYDRAHTAFQQAIDIAPELSDGYIGIASLYEQQQLWQEALLAYQQSLERWSQWAGLIPVKISEMKWELGKHGDAEAELLDILRGDSKNDAALNTLYSFADDYYQKLGQAEAALRIYREIREIKGQDEEAYFQNNRGNVYYYNGDYRAAADAYTQAIAHNPHDAVFHSNLGRVLRELREWERALEEFGKAFELDQDEETYREEKGLTFNAMGNAHYSHGEFSEAITCYGKAIEHVPEHPVFHSNLALAWEDVQVPGQESAELEQAITALRQAVDLQPDSEEYRTRLASLERRRSLVQQYGELILRFLVTTPVAVEVSYNLVPKIDSRQDGGKFLYEDIPAMRERVERELGIRLPGARFRSLTDPTPNAYRILIDEVPAEEGTAWLDWRYCPVDPALFESSHASEYALIPAPNPRTGEPGCWLPEERWTSAVENGLELWTETEFLINHLEIVMRRHLPILFGMQEAQNVLDRWAQSTNGRSLAIKAWDVDTRIGCARLLRTLLAEQVPITARDEILDVIADRRLDGCGVVEAVHNARLRLKRELPGNALEVQRIHLPPALEAVIGGCLQKQGDRVSFSVSPVEANNLLVEIVNLVPVGKRNVALVVRNPDLRPFIRRLVAYTLPYLMVMSAEELMADEGMLSSTLSN
jgi:tetratricopeptide (TPR) repeat protein